MMFFKTKNLESCFREAKLFFDEKVPLFRQKMTQSDGFATENDALKFGNNSCGAACLKMALTVLLKKDLPTVKELMENGMSAGHYREPVGWIHSGIAEMSNKYGISAECVRLKSHFEIAEKLSKGGLLILSVSCGFQKDKRGGHLVVVWGIVIEEGNLKKIFFNDPSLFGQTHNEIDGESFLSSWSGNGVFLKRKGF